MIASFIEMLVNSVFDFLGGFFTLFPSNPVDVDSLASTLNSDGVTAVYSWVNWFLPFDIAAPTVALWATAMMAYVGLKLAFRYSDGLMR